MPAIETIELVGPYEFDLMLTIEDDYDSSPEDAECYDAADLDGWRAGDWQYVGYIVTASRNGIELGHASIWGTEYGYIGGAEYGAAEWIAENYYFPDLIIEATQEAAATLAALTR